MGVFEMAKTKICPVAQPLRVATLNRLMSDLDGRGKLELAIALRQYGGAFDGAPGLNWARWQVGARKLPEQEKDDLLYGK